MVSLTQMPPNPHHTIITESEDSAGVQVTPGGHRYLSAGAAVELDGPLFRQPHRVHPSGAAATAAHHIITARRHACADVKGRGFVPFVEHLWAARAALQVILVEDVVATIGEQFGAAAVQS